MKSYYPTRDSVNNLVLVKTLTDSCNLRLQGSGFVSILNSICEHALNGDCYSGDALDVDLYLLLNLKGLLEAKKTEYKDLCKGTRDAMRAAVRSRIMLDNRDLFPNITSLPIYYGEPEKAIVEMHFSGALGLGYKLPQIPEDLDYSSAIKYFSMDCYKRVRSASSVEELADIENRAGKQAVLELLLGYYIDEYAGIVHLYVAKTSLYSLRQANNAQDKLAIALNNLQHDDEWDYYLRAAGKEIVGKERKKELLKPHMKKNKYMTEVIELLDKAGLAVKVGSKACSKGAFASFALILYNNLATLWSFTNYKECREMLSLFYGIQDSTYKISNAKGLPHDKEMEIKKMIDSSLDKLGVL